MEEERHPITRRSLNSYLSMAKPIITVGAVSNRTYRSISTGKGETAVPNADGVGYQEIFVDIETGRAAQVGDILEVSVQSPNPSLGLHPVRHTVSK